MEWHRAPYTISTERHRIDFPFVHAFLSQSYWAAGIPEATVARSIEGSICFGIYSNDAQVGFARVITDSATFAYLADVFVDEKRRGKGLSKWLMECILAHPDLQGLRRFLLATRDAHGLYAQFGFEAISKTMPWMQRHQPDVYR